MAVHAEARARAAPLQRHVVGHAAGQELAVSWTFGTREDPGYRLVLELPGELPELPQKRRHWRHHARAAARWRQLLSAIIRPTMRPEQPLERARLLCVRRSYAHEPDYENLAASFKPVVDALTRSREVRRGSFLRRAEVLADDSPRVVTREYRWESAPPHRGGIRVEVDEVIA